MSENLQGIGVDFLYLKVDSKIEILTSIGKAASIFSLAQLYQQLHK
jgi:hypothetical protein